MATFQQDPQTSAAQRPEAPTYVRAIPRRSIAMVYILGICTFGIYWFVWFVSTKDEMNSLGAQIPTALLLFIPVVNLYWIFKYAQGFGQIKGDNNTALWWVLFQIVGVVTPAIVQSELNSRAAM